MDRCSGSCPRQNWRICARLLKCQLENNKSQRTRLRHSMAGDWEWKRCSDFISQKVFIKSVCTSQFPYKSVNLFFILAILKDQLTDLCGNWRMQKDFVKTSCKIRLAERQHSLLSRMQASGFRAREHRSNFTSRLSNEGQNQKVLKTFTWKTAQATARIWPWLSY
jgi:hypothetical protein